MAGEPDIAASQSVDALGRQVAALTRENARLAQENARLAGELQQRTDDLRQSREYQAAIAMENARLLGELSESLDRQTAMAEVLQVISRSPGELEPVLDAILANAARLCEAQFGSAGLRVEGGFQVAAEINLPAAFLDYLRAHDPMPIVPGGAVERMERTGQIVHIADLLSDTGPGSSSEQRGILVDSGARTMLWAPMVKDGRVVGMIHIYRTEAQPFTERQIGLLRTFADQAVIAMENARLLGELREALDQQTATGDVLKTISRSSTDLGEVLDTLLAAVARLCKADQTYMFRRHGEQHHLVAAHGVSAEGEAFIRANPVLPERGTTSGRVAVEKRVVHIHDVLTDPEYTYAEGQRTAGFRTMLGLPLLKEDTLVGLFVLSRTTVDPFSAREIELASGFADQAMIAIENARLFEELRDRQAELRVTLDNTGDGVVMFDADFRLASWNRNFQEMLDIPDDFVAGRPALDDYVRLLVGRGELGEGDPERIVAGYRERATLQWSVERTRPDGRIVEVRNNPVPDGGAVLIYSDITERKRAEAQIAAARDAAEEALEQQTATAEILQAISQSPTDVQPVLDAVVKAAVRFCGATDAVIILREGDGAFFAAHEGPTVVAVGSSFPLNRETSPGRAMLDGRTCHLPDIAALDPVEFAAAHRLAAAQGFRASLGAPLLRQNTAIGSVTLRKAEAGPFTPRQIELLETFAAQAVIAIENVRLFNDLSESLERQTATADILKVIASSPNDVLPVFDVVVKAAVRLCGAQDSVVVIRHGSEVVFEAHEGPLGGDRGDRWPLVGENVMGRAIIEGRTIHVADASALAPGEFDRTQHGMVLYGFKAIVAAPLMRKGIAIGALLLRKREPGPFTPRQIELLETFAAQAVIAIENVRLFNDLREALEQQTATADILRVISQSPTDVAPVLTAVARAALKFCGARDAQVVLRDGDSWSVVAHEGPVGALGGTRRLSRQTAGGRAMVDGEVVQIADLQSAEGDEFQEARELGARLGFRSALAAPLLRDDVAIGAISLRRPEAGAFTPRQVELLQSFAAQAVIAIENVRLFTELRDALEQQTATADILSAISRSPTDVQPVLEAVTGAALRFCGAPDAIVLLRDGDENVVAAHQGTLTATLGLRMPIAGGQFSARALLEGRTLQVADVDDLDPAVYAGVLDLARQHGWRASAAAPMMHGGKAIGCVVLRKPEPGLLSLRQIALLETFAAQAVIAIENVRLFTELRDSLERQTATADILKVIASSPADTKPAFDTIADSANRLLGGLSTTVWRLEGDAYHLAAFTPTTPAADEALKATSPLSKAEGDAIMPVGTGDIWEIADIENASSRFSSRLRDLARLRGYRAMLFVPLLVRDTFIGFVSVTRREPGAFRPDDVQLLKTFADQAVIAIQNARLFNELSESLEQQTATGDILKAIASSPTDVQPVLDAVAKAAVRFCGTTDAVVSLRDGNEVTVVAYEGPLGGTLGLRRAIDSNAYFSAIFLEGRTVHFPDIQALDPSKYDVVRQIAAEIGFRAVVGAPLLREGSVVGSIGLRRREPGAFTPEQIELLKTFAAQAVIAIENVRLFTELKESLEQQTATGEILSAISRSPTDVKPVLAAVTRAALRFCGAPDALVLMREGDENVVVAHEGTLTATLGLRRPITANFSGQALLEGRTLQIADVDDLDADRYAAVLALARENGWRSSVAAPMMHGGKAIGCVVLRKPEPGLLSPRQIALLETFAAQAVIAIENVRLFNDLRESLDQQTATAEILRVISQSPTDVTPVLDAVVRAAIRFCDAEDATVALRDGDSWIQRAHVGPLPAIVGERFSLARDTLTGRTILDGRAVHVPDAADLDPTEFAGALSLHARLGVQASLVTPMLREGVAIGGIHLRRRNPGAFTDRQILLAEAFAAQAVIAIENVRLFTELKESLEQQTATAEILRVIASSPADTRPAFEAIASNANRLLGGLSTAVFRREGELLHLAAFTPINPEADEALQSGWPLRVADLDPAMLPTTEGRIVQIPDTAAETVPARFREVSAKRGNRSLLAVPLMAQGEPIGTVNVARATPGAFEPDDVQLLQTFADQAVIAIQNARLLTELRNSLEQQTATAEILTVISQSPTDVGPVLSAVARAAMKFCGANDALVILRDGDDRIIAAHEGPIATNIGERRRLTRHTAPGRAMTDREVVQIVDLQSVEGDAFPEGREVGARMGFRSALAAPLLRDDVSIGAISLRRREAGAFEPRQVELLKTFAAQAVIAIENVRLFTELRDSLERLKAAQANLIQSEKMASLGQLTAGIAHEIKNPLNFVNNFAALSVELLGELKETADAAFATLDADTQAEVDETMELLTANLGKIAEHGRRADGIVRSMLSHSRGGSGDWTPSDINALVEEALNLAYHGARAQDNEFNVTLERDLEKNARPIEVVPQDVTRVFLNLFGNGFYAVGKRRNADKQAGFRPTLRVSTRDLGEAVEVRVRDNGTGIPSEVRAKLFQPFFTTKPTGEGTGLGLSISYDIVTQQHGGTIEVESEPGSFTEFTVRLPRRRVQTSSSERA